MTYNVHSCLGRGGRDSTALITSVCRDANADFIALQELDAPETDEEEGTHHARDLASHLGMELLFCRTFRREYQKCHASGLARRKPTITTRPAPIRISMNRSRSGSTIVWASA